MAQALIEFLSVQSVERDGRTSLFFGPVLGIFGHGNVGGIGEALAARQDRIRFVPVRNEQAMVHSASAYAWAKRRLGALACTSSIGPGATNMVTAAAGATINRLPVLLLPGDIFTGPSARPVLQQLDTGSAEVSVNDTLRPVSRFWQRITQPQQLVDALPEAMRVLTSPSETGAVTLALPQDVQVEAYAFPAALFEPRAWQVARPEPDPGAIAELGRLLLEARRPLIIAGGGVRYSEAESELAQFAAEMAIPVAETQAGRGTLSAEHPLNLGAIGATGGLAANRYAAEADLVIAIGSRLGDFTTASGTAWPGGAKLVAINVDDDGAHRPGGLAIVADARQALRALREWAPAGARQDGPQRMAFVSSLRAEWASVVNGVTAAAKTATGRPSQAQVIGAVNKSVAGHGTMVNAAGSMPGDLHKLWRAGWPDDYHVEYGYSCMGYEIAGGLGVKLADPAREVIVLVGDGSYLMLNSEIVTSIQEALPLTVVVVDSHGYRSIHSLATSMGAHDNFNLLRRRDAATGRLNGPVLQVDYVAHAGSMGARALRATTLDQFETALSEARASDVTTVIVVEIDPANDVPNYGWWEVPVAEVSESEPVREARSSYEIRRAAQPWRR